MRGTVLRWSLCLALRHTIVEVLQHAGSYRVQARLIARSHEVAHPALFMQRVLLCLAAGLLCCCGHRSTSSDAGAGQAPDTSICQQAPLPERFSGRAAVSNPAGRRVSVRLGMFLDASSSRARTFRGGIAEDPRDTLDGGAVESVLMNGSIEGSTVHAEFHHGMGTLLGRLDRCSSRMVGVLGVVWYGEYSIGTWEAAPEADE